MSEANTDTENIQVDLDDCNNGLSQAITMQMTKAGGVTMLCRVAWNVLWIGQTRDWDWVVPAPWQLGHKKIKVVGIVMIGKQLPISMFEINLAPVPSKELLLLRDQNYQKGIALKIES